MLESKKHQGTWVARKVKNIRQQVLRKYEKMSHVYADMRASKTDNFTDSAALLQIRAKAIKRTDINDHLEPIFFETLIHAPKLIVELGVRGGESIFVLERAAAICRSKIVSVDILDCSRVSTFKDWNFIQESDIDFAPKFKGFCKKKRIVPEIDVLFIDTSHLYEHTVAEIKAWFPFLSERAKVFFHDTNLGERYVRKDGSINFSKGNDRGVIRAIEEYLNTEFNEKVDFATIINDWVIRHYAHCNGLTILNKVPSIKRK